MGATLMFKAHTSQSLVVASGSGCCEWRLLHRVGFRAGFLCSDNFLAFEAVY